MAERFMQTVLTPLVLAAQEHYYGCRLRQRIAELEARLKAQK